MMNKDTIAQAVVTQQIALATGVTTITLTFYKNFSPSGVNNGLPTDGQTHWLIATWGLFGCSILAGLVALMVLVNKVPTTDSVPGAVPGAAANAVVVPAMIQTVTFLAGFACMLYAVISVV